ncbi:hypothetical protein BLX87_22930 [Bacillus sp. VT-16-64]|nr:hypothetical protein BLX87_22930 [Bacillus sp. VT-16-64]
MDRKEANEKACWSIISAIFSGTFQQCMSAVRYCYSAFMGEFAAKLPLAQFLVAGVAAPIEGCLCPLWF